MVKVVLWKELGIRIITEEDEKKKKKSKGVKKFDRRITYHHIFEKHNGGEVSIENGANLAAYNHAWLHQQPPEVKEEINKRLQEFKHSIDVVLLNTGEKGLNAKQATKIEFDMSDTITIPVYDTIEEVKIKKKFNRAKAKQELKQLIDEELYR